MKANTENDEYFRSILLSFLVYPWAYFNEWPDFFTSTFTIVSSSIVLLTNVILVPALTVRITCYSLRYKKKNHRQSFSLILLGISLSFDRYYISWLTHQFKIYLTSFSSPTEIGWDTLKVENIAFQFEEEDEAWIMESFTAGNCKVYS